jgi:hypothetical protein
MPIDWTASRDSVRYLTAASEGSSTTGGKKIMTNMTMVLRAGSGVSGVVLRHEPG